LREDILNSGFRIEEKDTGQLERAPVPFSEMFPGVSKKEQE